MGDQSVQIGVGRLFKAKVVAADVVDGFIVQHEGNVRVFQKRVSREHRVVGLNNTGGDLRRGEHAEIEFALLAVIDRQSLQKQSTEAGTGTTAYRVEDEEALKAIAVLGKLSDFVQDGIDVLLADCVVTTSVVVRGVLLASDQLIRVKELRVFANFDVIDDGRFQIEVDATGHVFAGTGLAEEGIEGYRSVGILPVLGEGSIGVDSVFEAIELPA